MGVAIYALDIAVVCRNKCKGRSLADTIAGAVPDSDEETKVTFA